MAVEELAGRGTQERLGAVRRDQPENHGAHLEPRIPRGEDEELADPSGRLPPSCVPLRPHPEAASGLGFLGLRPELPFAFCKSINAGWQTVAWDSEHRPGQQRRQRQMEM